MECLPIVQDDFPPDYKSVREMLRTKLETCNAVVHLAGFYYGAEPQPVLEGSPDRRSFTQLEYEIAVELGLPCYVFLCGKDYPFDEHDPEPEEKQALQLAHRGRLLERDELYYEFETREDLNSRTRELQLSVEGLRKELAKERARRRMTMVVSAVALLVAVAGGVFLYSKTQSQEAVIAETVGKLEAQSELIAQLLAEQERLRAVMEGGEDVAAQAEVNVAEARGETVAAVRAGVEAELEAAGEMLAVARADGNREGELAALLRVAAAERALGRTTEQLAAYEDYLELVDRSTDPEKWAVAMALVSETERLRNPLAGPSNELIEAVGWAAEEPRLGPDHPATLGLVAALADVVPPEQAVGLRERIAAAREADAGPDDLRTLHAKLELAESLDEAEQFDVSAPIYSEVIAAWEREFGPKDALTLQARAGLARSLQGQGKFVEAEEVYREIIALADEEFGPGNETSLGFSLRLSGLYEATDDGDAQIATLRRALNAVEERSGSDSERAVYVAGMLAHALVSQDRNAEAETLARRVVDARTREIGSGQAATISAMKTLSRALKGQDRIDDYELVMRELIAAEIEAFGPEDDRVAKERLNLGITLLLADRLEAANAELEASYEQRVQVLGADHPDVAEPADFRAASAFRADDWPQVESWSRRALVVYESNEDMSRKYHVEALFQLAFALEELGENAEALELAQRVVTMSADLPTDERKYLEPATQMIERLVPNE